MKTANFLKGININRVIQFMTYSDVAMMGGWGLINPILAVFFTDQIIGGSIVVAGLATAVYFVTKSILQIPIARYVDLKRGEQDDFWIMIAGSLLITLSAFLFIGAKYPWHIYLIQFLSGVGGALSYPTWLAIFTRHIDRCEEGLEWSLYYTAVDLGSALAAGLGGVLVSQFGYQTVFLLVGLTSFLGTLFLAGIARNIKKR
ncbi:MAG: MFS transporter [Patescibacteria group bacterium]